ncbi:hypothetical protein AVDCRST_MAG81-5310 [uncultured Synechococcales cyanobacterium]|uniref:Uncharacterized protein n=1 Tax=uncultured Synechococcales cyanobacterium TaxID=1936017 RepID=A0A6N3IPK9_9CYAN|nr:hypothetical protein AVDCRST_MAG81-5310 [uncultured Synechococcales cyanobacterium]
MNSYQADRITFLLVLVTTILGSLLGVWLMTTPKSQASSSSQRELSFILAREGMKPQAR